MHWRDIARLLRCVTLRCVTPRAYLVIKASGCIGQSNCMCKTTISRSYLAIKLRKTGLRVLYILLERYDIHWFTMV